MLGGVQATRSEKLVVDPVLPLLVVPSGPCCGVAVVAALKLQYREIKIDSEGNSCEPKDQIMKEFVQVVPKLEGGVGGGRLTLVPALGAGCEFGKALCWELGAGRCAAPSPGPQDRCLQYFFRIAGFGTPDYYRKQV